MTTTNGVLTLPTLRERSLPGRRLDRPNALLSTSLATHPAASGRLSDRAMIAFVLVKETAAAVAITAIVLAAILL